MIVMVDFRGINSDIAHTLAIGEDDGVPVVYPFDGVPTLGRYILGSCENDKKDQTD